MNKPVYVIDCKRTPIGRPNKSLKTCSAPQLAVGLIDVLLEQNKIPGEQVSEVILGNTVSAGTGQNLARTAVALSQLPVTVPAYVVNNVCGSGLQAIISGIQKILAEDAGIVIAGAAESATHNPQLIFRQDADMVESLINDGLFCSLAGKHMGEICDDLAKKNKISRMQQDEYALESHRRACAAR